MRGQVSKKAWQRLDFSHKAGKFIIFRNLPESQEFLELLVSVIMLPDVVQLTGSSGLPDTSDASTQTICRLQGKGPITL